MHRHAHPGRMMAMSRPQALPSFVPSTLLYGPGVAGPMPARLQELRGELQGVGGNVADLERVWGGWEQWRVKEEAVFAQRLREKVTVFVCCVHLDFMFSGSTPEY